MDDAEERSETRTECSRELSILIGTIGFTLRRGIGHKCLVPIERRTVLENPRRVLRVISFAAEVTEQANITRESVTGRGCLSV